MIVILGLLFLEAATAVQYELRIVGGYNAVELEFPYIVSIWRNNRYTCGGSIISARIILTAFHCVYADLDEPGHYKIDYGHVANYLHKNAIQVKYIYMHENGYFDVALLELEEDIQFGASAQPVKLPASTDKLGDDAAAVVVGFGLKASGGKYPKMLQKVDVVIFTDEFCKSTEPSYNPKYHLCAGVPQGGKGECNGDSGGPLTVDGVQYGVVSWSVKPCTSAKHPGIYVPVTAIRDWITEVTGI